MGPPSQGPSNRPDPYHSQSQFLTFKTRAPQCGPYLQGLKAHAIPPTAENLLFMLLPAWGLRPELCVYTFKRIESHIIMYVTKASAISNINEDK